MLKRNERTQSSKRLALTASDAGAAASSDAPAAKRLCPSSSPMFAKRLESVVLDRQMGSVAANAVNNAQ